MTRARFALIGGLLLLGVGALLLDRPASDRDASASPSTSVSDCDLPLTYHVGTIDARFDLTEAELVQVMQRVGRLWSRAAGQPVLRHQPDGDIAVHLRYSDSQRRADQERRMGNRIEALQDQYADLDRRHKRLSETFDARLAAYKRLLDRHNEAVDRFNADVTALQSNGGIPADQRESFTRRERRLNRMAKTVHQKRREVDSLRQAVNAMSTEVNALAQTINQRIENYNRRFGQAHEFDQGKYQRIDGQERIDVFQFSSRDELALVLAHEVGHALGLRHLDDSAAIMYYLMDKQDIGNLTLTPADVAAIQSRCGA